MATRSTSHPNEAPVPKLLLAGPIATPILQRLGWRCQSLEFVWKNEKRTFP